jgi:glutamate/tyrosine decarboxylase-like PLP-dependent enzyme
MASDRREDAPLAPLDLDLDTFRSLGHAAVDAIADFYADLGQRRVFPGVTPAEVRARFDEALPDEGHDPRDSLSDFFERVLPLCTHNTHPRFFGYIMSGGNHIGVLAELLAATVNQNCAKWDISPAAAELEQVTLRWLAEFIGYPTSCDGILTSGGSMANLTCLAVARAMKAGGDVRSEGVAAAPAPLVGYASTEVHSCHDKAFELMGLGRSALRKIPVDDDYRIDVAALERNLQEDKQQGLRPFLVIANAGTVNTGAVDPIQPLLEVSQGHDLWLHVDGAYGALAAASTQVNSLFAGLDQADSVALDPHKWLSIPFDVGCSLIRNPSALRDTHSLIPAYLRKEEEDGAWEAHERHFTLSRSFRALKVWMSLRTFGRGRFVRSIESNIDLARHLSQVVQEAPDFELLAPVPLSIVCFRYVPPDAPRDGTRDEWLNRLNASLADALLADGRAFLSRTTLKGKLALRACILNHRTSPADIDILFHTLRELGQAIDRTDLHLVGKE